MFEQTMIGCCGLDCSACSTAYGDSPCRGCGGPEKYKPEFCRSICGIKVCEKRINDQYRFCYECPEYPCEITCAHDQRCQAEYISRESPFENLKRIQEVGVEKFLHEERDRWTCVECGGVIRSQDGICSGCGRNYSFD